MPLRDHFQPPLNDLTSWESFHGGWPMMIVANWGEKLPDRYVAELQVHLGRSIEIEVATFFNDDSDSIEAAAGEDGGVATAVWHHPGRRSPS